MSFLSSETLKTRLRNIIDPPDENRVKHGAYELSLGPTAYITSTKPHTRKHLNKDEQLIIPSGQFALLVTEEFVSVPDDLIAFISIKFSLKYDGLVNVSGFHVDPGFKGRLKFSVYNAGPNHIVISRGSPLFLIWFSKLDKITSNLYDGEHKNQNAISNRDVMRMHGYVASPESLREQIRRNKNHIKIIYGTIAVLVTIAGLFLGGVLNRPSTQSIEAESASLNRQEALIESQPQMISDTTIQTTSDTSVVLNVKK